MTGGMAGIAGTVFVLYATILRSVIPDVAGHIRRLDPGRAGRAPDQRAYGAGARQGSDRGEVEIGPVADNTMDAIVRGTVAGLELLLNIVAMLIVLVALVHLANSILGLLPDVAGSAVTLQRLLGLVMAPVCWLMGVPWSGGGDRRVTCGHQDRAQRADRLCRSRRNCRPDALDPRSRLIMLYAMCGFANFGTPRHHDRRARHAMAPERRDDINLARRANRSSPAR